MNINPLLSADDNILELLNAANPGAVKPFALDNVSIGVVEEHAGSNGNNSQVLVTAIANQGFSGTKSIRYRRLEIMEAALDKSGDLITVPKEGDYLAAVIEHLGLRGDELETSITAPAFGVPGSASIAGKVGSKLYLTQSVQFGIKWPDLILGDEVAVGNLAGFVGLNEPTYAYQGTPTATVSGPTVNAFNLQATGDPAVTFSVSWRTAQVNPVSIRTTVANSTDDTAMRFIDSVKRLTINGEVFERADALLEPAATWAVTNGSVGLTWARVGRNLPTVSGPVSISVEIDPNHVYVPFPVTMFNNTGISITPMANPARFGGQVEAAVNQLVDRPWRFSWRDSDADSWLFEFDLRSSTAAGLTAAIAVLGSITVAGVAVSRTTKDRDNRVILDQLKAITPVLYGNQYRAQMTFEILKSVVAMPATTGTFAVVATAFIPFSIPTDPVNTLVFENQEVKTVASVEGYDSFEYPTPAVTGIPGISYLRLGKKVAGDGLGGTEYKIWITSDTQESAKALLENISQARVQNVTSGTILGVVETSYGVNSFIRFVDRALTYTGPDTQISLLRLFINK